MPSYAYKCPKCSDVQVIMHPMNHEPSIMCAACSIYRIKVPQAVGIAFKGGGWAHKE